MCNFSFFCKGKTAYPLQKGVGVEGGVESYAVLMTSGENVLSRNVNHGFVYCAKILLENARWFGSSWKKIISFLERVKIYYMILNYWHSERDTALHLFFYVHRLTKETIWQQLSDKWLTSPQPSNIT